MCGNDVLELQIATKVRADPVARSDGGFRFDVSVVNVTDDGFPASLSEWKITSSALHVVLPC